MIGLNDRKNIHCLLEHKGSTRHKESISALCVFSWQIEPLDKKFGCSDRKWKRLLENCIAL